MSLAALIEKRKQDKLVEKQIAKRVCCSLDPDRTNAPVCPAGKCRVLAEVLG